MVKYFFLEKKSDEKKTQEFYFFIIIFYREFQMSIKTKQKDNILIGQLRENLLLFFEKNVYFFRMNVLILAAGYGTRLQRGIEQDSTGLYKNLLGLPKGREFKINFDQKSKSWSKIDLGKIGHLNCIYIFGQKIFTKFLIFTKITIFGKKLNYF